MDHRAQQRSLYAVLQQPECRAARQAIESALATTQTYDQICAELNRDGLFSGIKIILPQDLTRYRQAQSRAQRSEQFLALIAEDADTVISGAAANPSGPLAKHIRRILSEAAAAKLADEMEDLDAAAVTKHMAIHAGIEHDDRALDLKEERLTIERKRLELQERQTNLHKDRFQIAASAWQFILQWLQSAEPELAGELAEHSEKMLPDLEAWLAEN